MTESTIVAKRNGAWGEEVAAVYLKSHGFEIIDRNSRPHVKDARLEIDIVAWERSTDTMVFVEVKQHRQVSQYARRLRSIDRQKKQNLRKVCNCWRRVNGWEGAFRFDVVEVYGEPDAGRPLVDHIENVELFPRRGRFVKWS